MLAIDEPIFINNKEDDLEELKTELKNHIQHMINYIPDLDFINGEDTEEDMDTLLSFYQDLENMQGILDKITKKVE